MASLPHPVRAGSAILLAGMLSACAFGTPPGDAPAPAEIPELEARAAARPGDAGTLIRLGAAYQEAGRPDDAVEVLEQAREAAPRQAGAHYYLGLAQEEREQWPEAEEAYRAFLELEGTGDAAARVRDRLPSVRRHRLIAEARASLEREAELAGAEPQQGTVAVFPFRYAGSDPELAPLGRALAELTVSDLGLIGRVTVLERLRVQLLLDEMELAEEGLVDPSTAARSGRLLGAGRIVQGAIDGDQDRVDVLAAVVPAGTGEAATPVTEEDELQRLYDLQKRLVIALHGSLGIELTEAERELLLQQPTLGLQALLLYGRALEAEDRGDFALAAQLYAQVLVEEPGFEAAQDAQVRTSRAADAGATPPSALGPQGVAYLPPGDPGIAPIQDFSEVEAIIPSPDARDPSAELLGSEGIRITPATVELILRLPGGGE